jgi:hypothetical protein
MGIRTRGIDFDDDIVTSVADPKISVRSSRNKGRRTESPRIDHTSRDAGRARQGIEEKRRTTGREANHLIVIWVGDIDCARDRTGACRSADGNTDG